MVEYFLFYFIYVLSPTDGGVSNLCKHFPVASASTAPRSASSALALPAAVFRKLAAQVGPANVPLSFHWRADSSADVYLALLDSHLRFMVPEIQPQMANPSLTPPENILTTLLLRSSSPIWSRVDTGLRYANFFTGCLVEFWLNTYVYSVDEEGRPVAQPSFVLPSVDFLQALQVAARHYATVHVLALGPVPQGVDAAYKTLAGASFDLVRLGLYRYLRVAMSVWPVDGTLSLLVDVWMALISPWLHMDPAVVPAGLLLDELSPAFASAWRPFIVSTFFLFQSLHVQFFNFAAAALEGFQASGECSDLDEAVTRLGALVSVLLETMSQLLAIAPVLRGLEQEMARGPGFLKWSSGEAADTANQLRILEPESFKPVALFGSRTRHVLCTVLATLDSLTVAIFRRHQTALKDPSYSENEEDGNDDASQERLFGFILTDGRVPEGVKTLAKWTLQLREDMLSVFELQTEDFVAAAADRDKRPLATRDNEKKHAVFRRRMLNPPAPKMQLQYKLAARPPVAEPSDLLIRSYEAAILVHLLQSLSSLLTGAMRVYVFAPFERRCRVKLPRRIWEAQINLRFFAAYPNILFTVLTCVMVRLLWGVVF